MTQINYTYVVIGLFLLLLAGFVVWIILTIGNTGDSTNPSSSIPSNLTVTHTVGPVTKSFSENVFGDNISKSFAENSFTIKKSSKSLNNEYNFFDVIPKAAYTSSITISGQGTINWGDGVTVNVDNKTPILVNHVYQSEGSYTVIIKGKFTVLGLTTNDNPSSNVIGNLTVTDVICGSGNSFTTLICNSPVQTFTGLTKLPNLTEFQLGKNTIELDFNNYPKLTAVGLSDKGYGGDFDISTLRTSITSVYLNDNNITSVSNLSNLPNLVNLFLNKTSISTLNLSSNKKLQQLGLGDTNITSLGFISETENPGITYLDISNCTAISNLGDITKFAGLKTLIMDGLTGFTGPIVLSGLSVITSLSLKGCKEATNITVNGCTKLVSLDVTGCEKITGLSATGCKLLTNVIVKDCYLLSDMNFSNCSALTLGTINFQTDLLNPPSTTIPLVQLILNNCTSVINLDLSKCAALSSLDISGCDNISELILNECSGLNDSAIGGTIIKSNCPNLTKLKMSEVGIDSLDVSGLQKLVQVVVNSEQITTVITKDCPVLGDLDVDTSPNLEKLDASNCPNLVALYTYVSGGGNDKLKEIDISNCPKITLTTFGFVNLTTLETLNITNCTGITNLNTSGCTALTSLTFTGCSNITTLNLSGCSNASLGITSTIIFNNCPKLSILDVSDCVLNLDFGFTSQYLTSVTANNTNIWDLDFHDSSNLISVTADTCNQLRNVYLYNCSKLTTLNITDCANTLFTSLSLGGLSELSTLNLSGCTKLTNITSANIADNCPKLSILNVSNCILNDDFAITSQYLTSVTADNTNVWDLDFHDSSKLTTVSADNCLYLQNVYLTNCNMTQNSANALATQINSFTSYLSDLPREISIINQTGRIIDVSGAVWDSLRAAGKDWEIV